MFIYEKKLEFPVKIKQTNPKLASLILTQFGGLYGNSVYNTKKAHSNIKVRMCFLRHQEYIQLNRLQSN